MRVEDIALGLSEVRAGIDNAYREKYGSGSTGGMVSGEAAATTLRLLSK